MSNGIAQFPSVIHGLNLGPAGLLYPTEAAELLNWKILKDGQAETRQPIVQHSNTAIDSAVKVIAKIPIGGTSYELLAGANYKLYYYDGSFDPQQIGTLEGVPVLIGFNGVCLICDGSYLKYLDSVSSVKICYDDGDGSTGYQYNGLSETNSGSVELGNGTITRVCQKVTTQAWTAGYTIPLTTIGGYFTKKGTGGTGSVAAVVRLVSDDSVVDTQTLIADVTELDGTTASHEYITYTAPSGVMSPSTAYYVSFEYAGGDGSNCVRVHYNTVASGGLAYTYDGSYSADATKNLLAELKPGRPPKASFGTVHNGRPFVSGDSAKPGYMYYGNRSHLDWSTTDLGGYVSSIDDNANSFPIGGVESLYGQLYVFGKQDQPFIAVLTGATPDLYTLPSLFQKPWTTHRAIQNSGNDLWYASEEGAFSLSGVQEYGDLRYASRSDQISRRFIDYWNTSTAITGYFPTDGQFLVYMPGTQRVQVCNIKAATQEPGGKGIRYPWSEYEFYKDILTSDSYKWTANGDEYYLEAAAGGDPGIASQPDFLVMGQKVLTEGTAGSLNDHEWDRALDPTATYQTLYFKDADGAPSTTGVTIRSIIAPQCFSSFSGELFIGGSDGHTYNTDSSEYKDLTSNHIDFDWRGKIYSAGVGRIVLTHQQLLVAGQTGAQLSFSVYKDDNQRTAQKTWTYLLSIDNRQNVNDMTGDVQDAYYIVNPEGNKTYKSMRVTCFSLQPRIHNVLLAGKPLLMRGAYFQFEKN